jgi:hypothetical protein
MSRFIHGFALAACIACNGCTSPKLDAEMAAFSGAVSDVSKQYRSELGISPDAILAGQIDALVADRGETLSLTESCDAIGANDERANVSDCQLNFGGLNPALGTRGRAAQQLELLESYFAALQSLATATGPADVQNATAAALDAIGALSKAVPTPGLGAFAADLKAKRDPISKAAGFLVEQKRIAALRRVVTSADLPISRIVLDLKDTAESLGAATPEAALDRLDASQIEMDTAQASGSDAAYRAAVVAFLAEYERFLAYRRTALIPRLDLIASTHAALRDRIASGATIGEVRDLIAKLSELKAGLD